MMMIVLGAALLMLALSVAFTAGILLLSAVWSYVDKDFEIIDPHTDLQITDPNIRKKVALWLLLFSATLLGIADALMEISLIILN